MAPMRTLIFVAVAVLAVATPAAFAEDHARGRELYDLCAQCHGPEGEGNQLVLAPAIAGFSQWYIDAQLRKFRSGARGTHPKDVGGLRMYPMSLTLKNDEDIEALAAYVASLPPAQPERVVEDGDAARGKRVVRMVALVLVGFLLGLIASRPARRAADSLIGSVQAPVEDGSPVLARVDGQVLTVDQFKLRWDRLLTRDARWLLKRSIGASIIWRILLLRSSAGYSLRRMRCRSSIMRCSMRRDQC